LLSERQAVILSVAKEPKLDELTNFSCPSTQSRCGAQVWLCSLRFAQGDNVPLTAYRLPLTSHFSPLTLFLDLTSSTSIITPPA
jgi:hypothetical protein